MGLIPSWAIGVVVIIIATGVVRRLVGRVGRSRYENPVEPDLSRLTQALGDVQRRLGEIEERLDFAERILAKERDSARLAPPQR